MNEELNIKFFEPAIHNSAAWQKIIQITTIAERDRVPQHRAPGLLIIIADIHMFLPPASLVYCGLW